MLWLPLACLIVMTWCLQRASAAVSDALGPVRRKQFQVSQGTTLQLVIGHFIFVISDPSPASNRTQALLFQALRLRSWRTNLMQFCFADLGYWLIFLIGLFYFQVGGVFVLAFGGLLLLATGFRWPPLKALAGGVLAVGFFYLLSEVALRMSGPAFGADVSDLTMLLADNRPLALLAISLLMTLLVALTGAEYLGFAAALLGLSSGILSLNGAVALVWGERLGLTVRWMWESRGHVSSVRRMTRLLLFSDVVAWPMALLLLGFLRDFLQIAAPTQEDLLQSLEAFLFLSALTLIPFTLSGLVFGHFLGAKAPDDLLDPPKTPDLWIRSVAFRMGLVAPCLQALRNRQDEIERVRTGFNTLEWQKVPPPIREASEREADHLHRSRLAIEAHLLSRSDFFDHQLR